MAKILFVRSRIEERDYNYGNPPMGLLYIAANLLKEGHEVKIVDMRPKLLLPEDVLAEIQRFKPDIIGTSNLTIEKSLYDKVVALIKKHHPAIPVIAGGAHVNAAQEEVLRDPHIDYLVLGEGEESFPLLVEAILSEAEEKLPRIKGIAYRRNGAVEKTEKRPYIEDLDQLPFPCWDLLDLETYYRLPPFMPFIPKGRRPYMQIVSSRGCPYNCTFCHSIMGKRFRTRSPENVFAELETLYKGYGISEFEILDDCFNFDQERAEKICDLIIQSGIKMKLWFPNGLRGDRLSERLLEKLAAAGTKVICFAPESGSNRVQKVVRKNVNLEKLQKAITIAAKLGIHTHGFFMLGFPMETKKDLQATYKFMKESKLHTADFFICTVYPHTPMWDQVKEMGYDVPEDSSNINFHNTSINVSAVSTEYLIAFQRKLFMDFYFSPGRIFRVLKKSAVKKRYLFFYALIFIRRAILRKR